MYIHHIILVDIERVIKVLKQGEEPKPYEYWLTQEPHKRLEAVELLRRQYYGAVKSIERTVTISELDKV